MNPLVSVIIPVYNGAAFLGEALDSVCAQDYVPIEVIVADDGSSDDSPAIAERYPGVRVLRLSRGGVSRARNTAVAASSGEFLAFLDADDRWRPGKLEAQVALARARTDAGFFLCFRTHLFDGPIPPWFRGALDGSTDVAYEPSAWLVRRSVFDSVGGFDEERTLGEDTHWLSRAWDLGVVHVTHPDAFVERRIHGANATGTIANPRRVVLDILRESVGRKRSRGAVADG